MKSFYKGLAQKSLKQLLKNKNSKLQKEITKIYKDQAINQVNKRPTKDQYYHIKVPSVGFIAADLMDYSKFFHSNGGM